MTSLRNLIRELIKEEAELKYPIPSSDIDNAISRAFEILGFTSTDMDNDFQENSTLATLRVFMKRIAVTESGGNNRGLPDQFTHHKRNPFQLDDASINTVKNNVNMKRWRKEIDSLTAKDPRKPYNQPTSSQNRDEIIKSNNLSALFATLYVLWRAKVWNPASIHNVKFDEILGTTPDAQAKFWKKWYNTPAGDGKKSDFIDKNS